MQKMQIFWPASLHLKLSMGHPGATQKFGDNFPSRSQVVSEHTNIHTYKQSSQRNFLTTVPLAEDDDTVFLTDWGHGDMLYGQWTGNSSG